MLNFIKNLFCIYWDDRMVFIFQFVNVLSRTDLQVLKNPRIPWISPTWSRCMILLMFCWIQFASIFQRILHLCSAVIKMLVTQWCPTLCDPMDYSLPGSSVHGILQARILEWVAISFSRGSSWSRAWTPISCIAHRLFTIWATRKPHFERVNHIRQASPTLFLLISSES